MVRLKIKKFSPITFIFYLIMGALSLFMLISPTSKAEAPISSAALQLDLVDFASGLDQPLGLTNAGPGDNRVFVNEQEGRIKIIQPNGQVLGTPFLSITGRVESGGNEEGLLG